MFYDNAYNTPNYNYFAFNKLITSAGYGYGLPAAANLYHHMHLQQQQQQLHQQPTQPYDDIFSAIPTPYITNNGLYVMEDYYQLANKLKRYRPATIDRNEYLNGLMTGADKRLPNDATYHDLSNKVNFDLFNLFFAIFFFLLVNHDKLLKICRQMEKERRIAKISKSNQIKKSYLIRLIFFSLNI